MHQRNAASCVVRYSRLVTPTWIRRLTLSVASTTLALATSAATANVSAPPSQYTQSSAPEPEFPSDGGAKNFAPSNVRADQRM